MKYKVLGPRVLIKIKKASDKFEGSVIARPESMHEMDTITQTQGEVVELGPEAFKKTQSGEPWVKVGDRIRFQRYGAQRVGVKDDKEFEHWVINDIDILVIEEEDKENV